jgi:Uma2 family endonuclease
MAATTLISVEEYLSTCYEADREYIDGEVIERNMGESDHGGLQTSIASWLFTRRKALRIHVFTEMRTQVAPTRFRIPDIAVTTQKVKGRILREPPFLCIEVLSPEDRVSRMEVKIDDYLKFGVAHVWLIDPRKKLAWSYTREGRREAASVLTAQEPRIELPIAELFAELDEEVDISAE